MRSIRHAGALVVLVAAIGAASVGVSGASASECVVATLEEVQSAFPSAGFTEERGCVFTGTIELDRGTGDTELKIVREQFSSTKKAKADFRKFKESFVGFGKPRSIKGVGNQAFLGEANYLGDQLVLRQGKSTVLLAYDTTYDQDDHDAALTQLGKAVAAHLK